MILYVFISGNFTIDEAVLRSQGITDFSKYAATPGNTDLLIGKNRQFDIQLFIYNFFLV